MLRYLAEGPASCITTAYLPVPASSSCLSSLQGRLYSAASWAHLVRNHLARLYVPNEILLIIIILFLLVVVLPPPPPIAATQFQVAASENSRALPPDEAVFACDIMCALHGIRNEKHGGGGGEVGEEEGEEEEEEGEGK